MLKAQIKRGQVKMKTFKFVAELTGEPLNHNITDRNSEIYLRGTRFPAMKFVFDVSEQTLERMRRAIAHRQDVTSHDKPRKIVSLFFREVLLNAIPYSDVNILELAVVEDNEEKPVTPETTAAVIDKWATYDVMDT